MAATPAVKTGAPRPNIVLIVADDLGYGDLGCYGQERIRTPNLDKLAAEGLRFTSFYAGSTVCAPSRCALMTGLHTGHCWIRGNASQHLRAQDVTLAQILKGQGYHNGLVGKWGLGNEGTDGVPQKKGFEEFVGYLDQVHAHDYYPDFLWRYDFRTGFDDKMTFPENQHGRKGLYAPDLFSTGALSFVQNNRPGILNKQAPFFFFYSTIIPHATNELGRASGNGMQVPSDAPYSDEPWPQPERNKAAMITRLDSNIGALLDKLKAMKLDERTVVLFTSDNGPHREGGVDPKFFKSSGPLRGIKRDLYEGGIRVPLIVRWPGTIKPGQVIDQPLAFWDILPTLAELSGAAPITNSDGVSFAPLLLGQAQTNRPQQFYWEFHERGFQQAARLDHWKAVRTAEDRPLELYNLKEDLGETTNIAGLHPKVVERFEAYFETARVATDKWPGPGEPGRRKKK